MSDIKIEKSSTDLGREATVNGSTYVKPQDIEWRPTRFEGIEIKVLYQDKEKGTYSFGS